MMRDYKLTNNATILANLGSTLATNKIREAITKLSVGKRTAFGNSSQQGLADNLRAQSLSHNSASLNLTNALAALQIAQNSLDEIAALNQRLAELGTLNSNNSLLSTEDTASLNAETAAITSAIDNIVTNTKYNTISMLGTSDISLTIGSTINGSNQLSITIGGISSIASVTAASSATSTANTLSSTLGTVQGQVVGGVTASKAMENINSMTSSILEAAADNIEQVDYAAETAKLTKNVLLNKISLSLSAQANNLDASKLDLLR